MAARDGAHIIRRLQDFSRQKTPVKPRRPCVSRPPLLSEAHRRFTGLAGKTHRSTEVVALRSGRLSSTFRRGWAMTRNPGRVLTNLILNAVDPCLEGGSLEYRRRVVESAWRAQKRQASRGEVYVTIPEPAWPRKCGGGIRPVLHDERRPRRPGWASRRLWNQWERHGRAYRRLRRLGSGQGSIFTLRLQIAHDEGARRRSAPRRRSPSAANPAGG